jgi:hypothetical protein
MDCFKYERFFVKKVHQRLFFALFVQTGKKKWKSVKICEFKLFCMILREFARKSELF